MLRNITLRTFCPILVSDFYSMQNAIGHYKYDTQKELCLKKDINYGIRGLQFMEGIQKLKCSSCGITFMSETNSPLCPTCSESSSAHHHGAEHGCGCGGH